VMGGRFEVIGLAKYGECGRRDWVEPRPRSRDASGEATGAGTGMLAEAGGGEGGREVEGEQGCGEGLGESGGVGAWALGGGGTKASGLVRGSAGWSGEAVGGKAESG